MDGNAHGCADSALGLYQRLLDPSWLQERRRFYGVGGGGLFSSALTIWLLVRQRLLGGCSLEVTWVGYDPTEVKLLSPRSSRALSGNLSPRPSGFEHARHALPLELAMEACQRLTQEARSLLGSTSRPVFLLDGTTLTPQNASAQVVKAYPPATNQHGESHWPVMLLVVAHELATGLACLPVWGPMYGPQRTSELSLSLKLIASLPEQSMVIADRNLGIFRIAWELRSRSMLLRMTDSRAKSLLGKQASLEKDSDQLIVWSPSPSELRSYPELTSQDSVSGRLVVRHLAGPSKKTVRVCLFTTELETTAQELTRVYAQRWNIESDLRSLKQTVGLEILRSKSPDMLAKELVMAIAAYNLVRTVMALAAQKAELEPRRISFTRACHCIQLYAARDPHQPNLFEEMLALLAACPLPIRQKRKHPPRTTWRRPEVYPARKEQKV